MKDKVIHSFADLGSTGAGYDIALEISNKLQHLYFDGQFDKCIIVYNKFKSANFSRSYTSATYSIRGSIKKKIHLKKKKQKFFNLYI